MEHTAEDAARDQEDALIEGYMRLQRDLEARGVIPTPRRDRIASGRRLLEWIGALEVAFLVACFSIFVNFFVLNFIFHFGT